MLYIAAPNFYVINLKPDKDCYFNLCLFAHGFAQILSELSGHRSIIRKTSDFQVVLVF